MRVNQPIFESESSLSITRKGNVDGYLYGKTIVFTGALEMVCHEAADLASELGCDVGSGVTKKPAY